MANDVTQQMQVPTTPVTARLRSISTRAAWTTAPSTCAAFGTGHVSSLGHVSMNGLMTKPNPASGHRQPSEKSP